MTRLHALARTVAALCLMTGANVQAHVNLTATKAVAGSYTTVTLLIPHGCAGSPTTAVTVHLPAGFLVAKAMPKPGWQMSIRQARLAEPIVLHGRKIEESASLIRWEGGRLANDAFDEFSVFGKLGERIVGALPFRVVQTCEQGELDWNGAPGTNSPSPILDVQPVTPSPAAPSHGHGHGHGHGHTH